MLLRINNTHGKIACPPFMTGSSQTTSPSAWIRDNHAFAAKSRVK